MIGKTGMSKSKSSVGILIRVLILLIALFLVAVLVSDDDGGFSNCGTMGQAASPPRVVEPGNKKLHTYICPMDGYISDKPGKCPRCGMDLVEKK